jgi:ribose/xylose/arabinose/galactoside ABC-type transport system permease subunit
MMPISWKEVRRRLPSRLPGSIVMLLATIGFFSVMAPGFFSLSNATNIIRQGSVLALAAFGQTFIILIGGTDLSIGAVMGLSSSTAALLMLNHVSPPLAVLIALLVAIACGLINGIVTNYIKLDSFVATFGMWSMALGVALVITEERTIFGFPKVLRVFHDGSVLGIPVPLILVMAVWLILHLFLKRSPGGTSVYAIGGNEEAARLSGIPVKFRKTMLYAFSGFMAGLAGILFLARSNSASALDPIGYEFDTICAVVLGGTAMAGGRGGVRETLVGVTLLATLRNGMNVAGVNLYLQLVFVGVILILSFMTKQQRSPNRNVSSRSVPVTAGTL